ncbi:MAG: cytochrome c3 family protein [Acidobacteria bacterium]|nr:cytochrome c3 family protein [Acidobacteriota bacterium]
MRNSRLLLRSAPGWWLLLAVPAVVLLALLGAVHAAAAEPQHLAPGGPRPLETSCVSCHAQLDDALLEPTRHTGDDIHFLKGLSCHDCHGGNPAAGADGDPEAAHDRKLGWTGKPVRGQVPAFCARCHADAAFMKRFNPHTRIDQYSEYRTSVHGRRNAEGDERAAVCVDCHGVHSIRAVSDPRSPVYPTRVAETCGTCHADENRMRHYSLATTQYAEYRKSVHARALYEGGDTSAPTCNDCHGSHGAVPPGVENVAAVCGSCHGREATLFRETEAKLKLDLTPCIQCMVCHGNHAVSPPTDGMVGVGADSTCTGCHVEEDKGYKAAVRMADSIHGLVERLREASDRLDLAERAGVEVGPDRFALQEARDQLVEARVLVHSFDLERFLIAAQKGIAAADAGVAAGKRAAAELRTRRAGLGLSLVIIVAVIIALALKVREVDRKPAT